MTISDHAQRTDEEIRDAVLAFLRENLPAAWSPDRDATRASTEGRAHSTSGLLRPSSSRLAMPEWGGVHVAVLTSTSRVVGSSDDYRVRPFNSLASARRPHAAPVGHRGQKHFSCRSWPMVTGGASCSPSRQRL